jgi:hypothetical protein
MYRIGNYPISPSLTIEDVMFHPEKFFKMLDWYISVSINWGDFKAKPIMKLEETFPFNKKAYKYIDDENNLFIKECCRLVNKYDIKMNIIWGVCPDNDDYFGVTKISWHK